MAPLQLIDPRATLVHLLDAAVDCERRPLLAGTDATARHRDPPPDSPWAVYLLWGDLEHHPVYAGTTTGAGCHPVYVGRTRQPTERLSAHITTLTQAEDLDPCGFAVAVVPVEGNEAVAGLAEHLLIDELTPIWNRRWLSGFGSRRQGEAREASGDGFTRHRTWWSTLHPGRQWERAMPPRDRPAIMDATRAQLLVDSSRPTLWAPL